MHGTLVHQQRPASGQVHGWAKAASHHHGNSQAISKSSETKFSVIKLKCYLFIPLLKLKLKFIATGPICNEQVHHVNEVVLGAIAGGMFELWVLYSQ